jgi:hypothetical protein
LHVADLKHANVIVGHTVSDDLIIVEISFGLLFTDKSAGSALGRFLAHTDHVLGTYQFV